MSSNETATRALEEMAYEHVETQFSTEPRSVSIPCQLRFTEPVEQNTDAFHDALEQAGYTALDHEPARHHDGKRPHYEGEIYRSESFTRLKVLVFRGSLVRLFPKDGEEPTVDELETVIDALETGFGSPLEHDPIDGGGADA
ncbi:hypothetical protein ACFQO4_20730 [Saliphagus sp. GCM10025334]